MTGPSEWTRYWGEAGSTGAALGNAAAQAAIAGRWRAFFSSIPLPAGARALDVASGAASALAALPSSSGICSVCLDYAADALAAVGHSLPEAALVQGDAARLPFADNAFALIVSQFGIEYAGVRAFGETARALAPGGAFAAIAHLRGGPIDRECAQNARLLRAFDETGLLRAGRAVLKADHARAILKQAPDASASRAFAKALVRAGQLASAPLSPAATLIAGFRRDAEQLIARRAAYEPAEALGWIDEVEARLSTYAGRMNAMTRAALDDKRLGVALKAMKDAGVEILASERFAFAPGAEPAAWWLTARKSSA